ncbi:MAG: von Willebrand factor type A domain-containing protein [Defluviitaleaceae bacterium]|nr:von Willebrand factor type A domain-containing protein [Defluviitaleaceae bacterium]
MRKILLLASIATMMIIIFVSCSSGGDWDSAAPMVQPAGNDSVAEIQVGVQVSPTMPPVIVESEWVETSDDAYDWFFVDEEVEAEEDSEFYANRHTNIDRPALESEPNFDFGGGITASVPVSPPSMPAAPAPAAPSAPLDRDPFHRERYSPIVDNRWVNSQSQSAVSFGLQMDTASYRNIARFINNGFRPPVDAVRVAEMINYFSFDRVLPDNGTPFRIYTEIGPSPFNEEKHLAFIRIHAREIDREFLPANNLTFLIDTSGSMAPANRLPLLQQSLGLLVANLDSRDTVSIVTYAGYAQVLLDGVSGCNHEYIMAAINGLRAHGHTAGGYGIITAFELANQNFDPTKNNQIILATDGDFNVGVSSIAELEELMAAQQTQGIHMTLLGMGAGNFMEQTMETISRNGNGTFHYIDTLEAAHKIFVEEFIQNTFIIADEARAQVAFNPATVINYRLIGYENRLIENIHFDDDTRQAGQVGVGADLVIMFEIELADGIMEYVEAFHAGSSYGTRHELFTVRIRYHEPSESTSRLIEHPATHDRVFWQNTTDFTFAASVAAFGHILRDSEFSGNVTIPQILQMAESSLGEDPHGHRRSFVELVERYRDLP